MSYVDTSLQTLLETMPDAVVGVGVDGRISIVNDRAEALFGYARAELSGRHVEHLIPDAPHGAHATDFSSYITSPRRRPTDALEVTGRRRDGSEFPVEVTLRIFHFEGDVITLAVVRDISDRVRNEVERERLHGVEVQEEIALRLQQNERLESLGLLAGGVAHDVNNMVGAILNYASFISSAATPRTEGPDGEVWSQVRSDADQVVKAAERVAELTHQLLVFARRDIAQPGAVNLNDVIASVVKLLPHTIGEDVEIATTFANDLSLVFADASQLERVLINLAVNASDAMPAGGNLGFETAEVAISPEDARREPAVGPGRFVRLRVSDTGVGMDEVTLSRAFEPFFTSKPPGEGTGLGLSIVHGIVTQSGGSIALESHLGMGSTVTIWFPVTAAGPVAMAPPARVRPRMNGAETILVVDDDAALRDTTHRILSANGYDVMIACDGVDALAIASAQGVQIDLLVTDVVMPKMMGKEVAERIRSIFPEVRVLYISGYAYPVLTSQGILDPGLVLIEKPFTASFLLERVESALAKMRE